MDLTRTVHNAAPSPTIRLLNNRNALPSLAPYVPQKGHHAALSALQDKLGHKVLSNRPGNTGPNVGR